MEQVFFIVSCLLCEDVISNYSDGTICHACPAMARGRQIPTDSWTDGAIFLHSTVGCVPLKGKRS